MTFRARITLHQIEPLDRNVQLRFLSVIKKHELAARRRRQNCARRRFSWPEIESDQSTKPRDAVIDVHDIVANFQIAKVRKERRGARASLLLTFDRRRASFEC